MYSIQHFKANFAQDEVVDTSSDNPTGSTIGSTELHEAESSVRNLCFIWEDGRRAFFNYADLAWVDLTPTESVNVMLLYFHGQIVTLKGYQLSILFDLLFNHLPKTITANNLRYYIDRQTQEAFVTNILIKSN